MAVDKEVMQALKSHFLKRELKRLKVVGYQLLRKNTRLLKILCFEVGSGFDGLYFYVFRWLIISEFIVIKWQQPDTKMATTPYQKQDSNPQNSKDCTVPFGHRRTSIS